jgi:hypothetical protein
MNLKNSILILFVLIFSFSCEYPKISTDEIIYNNDFENFDMSNIDGGSITNFNKSRVLGDFNNDGFLLHLEDISDHDYVFISFDLYIHGSWDGNSNGFKENDRSDKWTIKIDPDMEIYNNNNNVFTTTFSNSPCFSDYCLLQSFPQQFPYNNIPKTGNFVTDLPEICESSFFGGKTSLYKIEKSFKHSGNAVIFQFYDELFQPNAIDNKGTNQSKCDESWSIDNIRIRIVKYE